MADNGADAALFAAARRRTSWMAAAAGVAAIGLVATLPSQPMHVAGAGAAASTPGTSALAIRATNFDSAAQSFRAGRFPEAYGRFVALADDGDREAAGIALFMHRHGERLFGSQWDASDEQLAAWAGPPAANGLARSALRRRDR